jgi:hypothetical protein
VFELLSYGVSAARLEITTRELGLPADPDDLEENYTYSEPEFTVPEPICAALKSAVQQNVQHPPLWLQVESSNKYLTFVPWERLLFPVLGIPLLRLPMLSVKPYYPEDAVHVILCGS